MKSKFARTNSLAVTERARRRFLELGSRRGLSAVLAGESVLSALLPGSSRAQTAGQRFGGRGETHWVNVMDFGAAGDGITDDAAAIQAAIDHVAARKTRALIVLPVAVYRISRPITIYADSTGIVGLGIPSTGRGDDAQGKTRGATIRYFGSETAVRIGVAPGRSGEFIRNIRMENIRIEVGNNTRCGLQVWHSAGGYFKKISIFGNKGGRNCCLRVQAGIDNIFEQLDINGLGQTPGAGVHEYVGAGGRLMLGYANDPATTTVFRRCYFHYCNVGVQLDYIFDFEDCIFEACNVGVQSVSFMETMFSRCWWEANVARDVYFAGGDSANFVGGRVNSYRRQAYFASGRGVSRVNFFGVHFSSAHPHPIVFSRDNVLTTSDGLVTFSGCRFPHGLRLGGSGATGSFPRAINRDQQLARYTFVQGAVEASTVYDPVPAGRIPGGTFMMPYGGNIVGISVYYAAERMVAGTFSLALKLNGVRVPGFSSPIQPNFDGTPQEIGRDIFENPVSPGDALSVHLETSEDFAITKGDMVVDVLVVHGPSGHVRRRPP